MLREMLSSMYLIISATAVSANSCTVKEIKNLATPFPVDPLTNNIIYPGPRQNQVDVNVSNFINLACPGTKVDLGKQRRADVVKAVCQSNGSFKILKQSYDFRLLKCQKSTSTQANYTGNSCIGGKEVKIRFKLGERRFIEQISLCFDNRRQTTLYTHYVIQSCNNGVSNCRSDFKGGRPFFTVNLNKLYTEDTQRKTINKLLSLKVNDTKYINPSNSLQKGHLAACADFFYSAERNSTSWYINAVPQWASFNTNNWKKIENDTRNYAKQNLVNLEIYTGTYGITVLPNKHNKSVQLFLSFDRGVGLIPVPELFWKIVYSRNNHKGIVLIGVNNPYYTKKDIRKYKNGAFCRDVSSKVKSWFKWGKGNRFNITKGYSFACSVKDFRKKVKYAPDLGNPNLLL